MLSKEDIGDFQQEFQEDLQAFKAAFDVLRRRQLAVEDTGHADYFTGASCVQVALHGLNVCITSTEGIIQDLEANKQTAPARPKLKVVKDGRD